MLSLLGATFSVPATSQATKLIMFVFDHTSMRPEAGSKRHTAPAVSIGCALTRCQRSRRRITWAAEAKSPSTSPKLMVFS